MQIEKDVLIQIRYSLLEAQQVIRMSLTDDPNTERIKKEKLTDGMSEKIFLLTDALMSVESWVRIDGRETNDHKPVKIMKCDYEFLFEFVTTTRNRIIAIAYARKLLNVGLKDAKEIVIDIIEKDPSFADNFDQMAKNLNKSVI